MENLRWRRGSALAVAVGLAAAGCSGGDVSVQAETDTRDLVAEIVEVDPGGEPRPLTPEEEFADAPPHEPCFGLSWRPADCSALATAASAVLDQQPCMSESPQRIGAVLGRVGQRMSEMWSLRGRSNPDHEVLRQDGAEELTRQLTYVDLSSGCEDLLSSDAGTYVPCAASATEESALIPCP